MSLESYKFDHDKRLLFLKTKDNVDIQISYDRIINDYLSEEDIDVCSIRQRTSFEHPLMPKTEVLFDFEKMEALLSDQDVLIDIING